MCNMPVDASAASENMPTRRSGVNRGSGETAFEDMHSSAGFAEVV